MVETSESAPICSLFALRYRGKISTESAMTVRLQIEARLQLFDFFCIVRFDISERYRHSALRRNDYPSRATGIPPLTWRIWDQSACWR